MNKYINSTKEFFYKLFKYKHDKKHLLLYLSQGLNHGSSATQLLESMADEYDKLNLTVMLEMVEKSLFYMEKEGLELGDAFKEVGLFDPSEALSYAAISKSSPAEALEHINKQNKSKNEFKYAILMLIFPVSIVLSGYLIFMPEVRDFALQMLEPINSVSSKKIPMPAYFEDRSIFAFGLLSILSLGVLANYLVHIGRHKYQRILFKSIKLIEREFILNNFTLLMQLMKSNMSLNRAVEVVLEDTKDPLTKKIFSDTEAAFEAGDSMSSVLEHYLSDYATISYLRSGEHSNQIESSLAMAISHNEILHKKLVAKLIIWMPLAGEMLMTLVLLLPLLDIIMLTTSGAMSFEV